jgi:hypothetical protein
MQQPITPTKEPAAAHKLIRTIDHLSARWGLSLPTRDAQWTPSKSLHEQSVEEKIVARIKFLIFKNQHALDHALEEFERNAVLISQGWKFKPKADQDVLPRRNSTASWLVGGHFLRRSAVDPGMLDELMKALLHLVDDAAKQVKRNLDQVTNNEGPIQGQFCSIGNAYFAT